MTGRLAPMKIATYNINNVNRRLPNLLAWLKRARPDTVCLQELKAADEAFPQAALRQAGYHALWRGQKTWNGVAILSRKPPILTRNALPGDPGDAQSRYIEAAIDGLLIGCLYLPNGKPMYTFWDYKRRRWERDAGLRIDHLLLSPSLSPRLKKGGVDREERGRESASDHAPAWIELR